MSGNLELQEHLRRHLILPYLSDYLYQQFLPEHTSEHAGGKAIVFLKPGGVGIRPLLCGSAWRRAFAACAAHSSLNSTGCGTAFHSALQHLHAVRRGN